MKAKLYSIPTTTTTTYVVLTLVVLLACLLGGPATLVDATCSTDCGARNPDIFQVDLPNGESYDSFYSWITSAGILTEGAVINSKWVAQNASSPNIYFNSTVPCSVNVTFVSSVSSNRNRLGWFLFNRSAPTGAKIISGTAQTLYSDVHRNILTSYGQTTPCLSQGSTVTLGPYAPNIAVGFYLDVNGHCVGPNATRLWSLDEENMKYDTSNWNTITKPYGRTAAVLRVRLFFSSLVSVARHCLLTT
jgi:hypothetical protein